MKVRYFTLRPSVILLSAALSMFAVSCGDDSESTGPAPVISDFTPTSGLPGATVTITGENFSKTAAQNIVSFNGAPATVISATESSLEVLVPEGATTGPISVTVNGAKATSSSSFTVLNTTITSFSPTSGVVGTEVTISGNNFSTIASENVVKFNGAEAEVTAATATSLKVIVPEDASDGKITVAIHGKVTTSANDFTIAELEVTETFPPIAAEGITVKISGNNFSPIAEYNIVEFGGVEATVTDVSEDWITVVVPSGATTGPLTVTVGSQTVTALDEFEVCGGGVELVISNFVALKTEVATSYSASFTITNVGTETVDLSEINLQNSASVDADGTSTVGAGGYPLQVNSYMLAPGESFDTGTYGGSIVGGNTTTHPYLIIDLYDYPNGTVPECNEENNKVVALFE